MWWTHRDWVEGRFDYNIPPSGTGPQVTADVTPIVAQWLRGDLNLGLVLRNNDERLGVFTNARCQTRYSNPVLDVTYY